MYGATVRIGKNSIFFKTIFVRRRITLTYAHAHCTTRSSSGLTIFFIRFSCSGKVFKRTQRCRNIWWGREAPYTIKCCIYTFNIVMKFRSYAIETAHNLKIILKSILIFIATKCRALWIKWTIASNAVYCSIILSLLCVRECKENFERDTPWHTFELQKKLIYQCAGRTIAHVIDPYLYEYMCRAQIFRCTHL